MVWVAYDSEGRPIGTIEDDNPNVRLTVEAWRKAGYRVYHRNPGESLEMRPWEKNPEDYVVFNATIKEAPGGGFSVSGLPLSRLKNVIKQHGLKPQSVRVEKTSNGQYVITTRSPSAAPPPSTPKAQSAPKAQVRQEYVAQVGNQKYVHGVPDFILDWEMLKRLVFVSRKDLGVSQPSAPRARVEPVTIVGDKKIVHGAPDYALPDWRELVLGVFFARKEAEAENNRLRALANAVLGQTSRYLWLEGRVRQEAMGNAVLAQTKRYAAWEDRLLGLEPSPNEWLARAWGASSTGYFYNPPPPMSPSEYFLRKALGSPSLKKQVGYGVLSGLAGTLEGLLNPAATAYSLYSTGKGIYKLLTEVGNEEGKSRESGLVRDNKIPTKTTALEGAKPPKHTPWWLTPAGMAAITASLLVPMEIAAISRLPKPVKRSITITMGVKRTRTGYTYTTRWLEPPSDIQRLGNKAFQEMLDAKLGGAIYDSFLLRDEYAVARYVENAYGASLGATPAGAAGARAKPVTPQLIQVEKPTPTRGGLSVISGRQKLVLLQPLEEARPALLSQKLYYIDWVKGKPIILPPKPPSIPASTTLDATTMLAPKANLKQTSILQPALKQPSITKLKPLQLVKTKPETQALRTITPLEIKQTKPLTIRTSVITLQEPKIKTILTPTTMKIGEIKPLDIPLQTTEILLGTQTASKQGTRQKQRQKQANKAPSRKAKTDITETIISTTTVQIPELDWNLKRRRRLLIKKTSRKPRSRKRRIKDIFKQLVFSAPDLGAWLGTGKRSRRARKRKKR